MIGLRLEREVESSRQGEMCDTAHSQCKDDPPLFRGVQFKLERRTEGVPCIVCLYCLDDTVPIKRYRADTWCI